MDAKLIEQLYLNGVLEAEQEYGSECRNYDRVLRGVSHVLRHAGVSNVGFMALSQRWHDPLAGVDMTVHPMRIFQWMEGKLGTPKSVELGSSWRLYKVSEDSYITKGAFLKKVDELIDSNIKRAYPKTRRNTKQYKELYAQVFEKATKIVYDELVEKKKHAVEQLKKYYWGEVVPSMDKVLDNLSYYTICAEDVKAVISDSKEVAKTLEAVKKVEKEVADKLAYYESSINELENSDIFMD